MKRILTASVATLGCKLNQSESDQISRQLRQAGVTLVPFGGAADLYIINSCTVTHVGDRKSRHLVRQAVRANPESFVAVVGCYAETDPGAVAAIEGVGAVLGNRSKGDLLPSLRSLGLEFPAETDPDADVAAGFDLRCPGDEVYSPAGARTRAFVKVQEGCDNFCSYCIVPTARGHQHSRPAGEVVAEIRALAAEGYQEVVLTGVNITAYGRDHGAPQAREMAQGRGLLMLLERVLAETDVPRIRLSSLQPEDWSGDFYRLWDSGRMCRHLHFSLQSGCDSVLRRMRRRYNGERYRRVVDEARRALPGVALTSDVIAGFPGETDAEHLETEIFLRSIGFAGLHVFKYSPRSGTPAAEMDGQVSPGVKQERSDRLMALAGEMSEEYRRRFLGTTLEVLWEEEISPGQARGLGLPGGWTGLSDNYVRVYAGGGGALGGSISGARAERLAGDGVVGTPTRWG